ncbi:hypothetical protein BN8_02319 [Fibrisoma limi BUZ 3]|uniref:DUF3431 domain-containing protein n=1 Tax=Fibrisoma limi BUZ 3 TaxID=1185876 RepID=I2GH65_9BACT|nr:DUF3431 domain-containing protein [Fibrisoma limi]CCH53240.1 hypothetical protein BN8_02319 [Fibrisoma limi BUZ 3]
MDFSGSPSSIELVVARYHEPLNWLRNVPKSIQITVYDKHEEAPYPGAIPLPNVGREAHTYLHHLVTQYNSLAEWTVFCQGKPFDHAYDFHHQLRAFAANPAAIGSFRWLGHIIDTDDNEGERLFRHWSKNETQRGLAIREFHRALLGSDGPATYTFVLGAQFAVHRTVVHQRPLFFYERALALAVTFPDAAHCFERTWDRTLGVVGIDPVWLDGRQTVYLKPVRKLQE